MTVSHDVQLLPAFAALGGHAVLDGHRMGASVQLDETYFAGQSRALQTSNDPSNREQRLTVLQASWKSYSDIDVGIDSFSEQGLWDASRRFRRQLRGLPEISYLDRTFPGRCFVVPEWLRTDDRLHYGARVYFFRDEDSPAPEDVVQKNIDAVVDDSFETFERYQGRLHGYPDCCIEFYQDRSPESPSPEWRSAETVAEWVRNEALGQGSSGSIDDILPRFPESECGYAFFAREFFPEPGCETARTKGRAIYQALSSVLPDELVEDYFKLLLGFNYLVARAVHTGADRRPAPGDLGREHLLFYLPLRDLEVIPRYAD